MLVGMKHDPPSSPRPVIALDSDGTVFPNMPLKFVAMRDTVIEYFGLRPVAEAAEAVIRFVNMDSRMRGSHRFIGLLRMMDLLAARPEPAAAGFEVPHLDSLRRYVEGGGALSNGALAGAADGDAELTSVLKWSESVNDRLARIGSVAPIPEAVEGIARLTAEADLVVVSQAPAEELRREWARAGLDRYAPAIAGCEGGTKTDQVKTLLAAHNLPSDRALVVGDAPGDYDAARATGAAFFPIVPHHEGESWRRLLAEAWTLFMDGRYAGPRIDAWIAEFLASLPDRPPWED